MLARATTSVSVLRGTSTDDYGDPTDTNTAIAHGVLCSLLEQSRWFLDQSSNTPMTVRTITARVGSDTDVRVGDRLQDEQTQTIYIVEEVVAVQNPLVVVDKKITLRHLD